MYCPLRSLVTFIPCTVPSGPLSPLSHVLSLQVPCHLYPMYCPLRSLVTFIPCTVPSGPLSPLSHVLSLQVPCHLYPMYCPLRSLVTFIPCTVPSGPLSPLSHVLSPQVPRHLYPMYCPFRSLGNLSQIFGQTVRGMSAGARVFEYMKLHPSIPLRGGRSLSEDIQGRVEFKGVHFTYPSRPEQVTCVSPWKHLTLSLRLFPSLTHSSI